VNFAWNRRRWLRIVHTTKTEPHQCEVVDISVEADVFFASSGDIHCRSGVTMGGGQRGQLPRAQQTMGRKTASPKYFSDHKSEFDEVC